MAFPHGVLHFLILVSPFLLLCSASRQLPMLKQPSTTQSGPDYSSSLLLPQPSFPGNMQTPFGDLMMPETPFIEVPMPPHPPPFTEPNITPVFPLPNLPTLPEFPPFPFLPTMPLSSPVTPTPPAILLAPPSELQPNP